MNKKIVFLLLLLFGLFFIVGLNLMGEKVVSYNTVEYFTPSFTSIKKHSSIVKQPIAKPIPVPKPAPIPISKKSKK